MSLNLFDHPICLETPLRRVPSTWIQHTPFAMFLIDILRPQLFVELGTFQGVSYCAFCQAVAKLQLNTHCFGIDTWEGDPHTGFYGQDILSDLRGHHALRYGSFSNLIQSTFDEAQSNFEDGTIDLLHIDGYHTYDAAKHDFENWLVKVSDRGVVLVHDIHVHERDFGVWKFWQEIKTQYPTFEVAYGCGLGMIAVGKDIPPGIRPLLDSSEEELKKIREAFEILGKRAEHNVDAIYPLQNQLKSLEHIVLQEQAHNEALQAHLDRVSLFESGIEQSMGFWLLKKYHGAIERFLPKQTRQRKFYDTSRHLIIQTLKPMRNLMTESPPVTPSLEMKENSNTKLPQTEQPTRHFTKSPLISVIIPVFNTPIQFLEAAIQSVKNQTYSNWELCICDDGSSKYETVEYLKQILDASNAKIRVSFSKTNEGISQATNEAVKLASGEYVAFLDHDDELTPNALEEVADVLVQNPQLDIVYSDQDKIDAGNNFSEPFFKPDWSPEFFRHVMYVGHLLVVRRPLVQQLGGFDSHYSGIQDYEFMLRASETTSHIFHIPKILYHWRKIPGSVAMGIDEKGDGITKLQTEAVNEHLKRTGIQAIAEPHPRHPHRVAIKPNSIESNSLISIILPIQGNSLAVGRCIDSILSLSTYENYEIVIVKEGLIKIELPVLANDHIRMVSADEKCNLSQKLNLGVSRTSGEIIVILNSDVKVTASNWLQTLSFYLNAPDVGAVGPLLLYPDGRVYHAGVVLGLRGAANPVLQGYSYEHDGYAGSLSSPREVSAVPADCMMFRKQDYQSLGGFNEYFVDGYYDLDFCLRLRKQGKRILYIPDVPLVKNKVENNNLDAALFTDRWNEWIEAGDPYYNRNFSLTRKDYELE